MSQRELLLSLYEDGPLDQSALRVRLNLEQSSVSRLVEGLARRGFIDVRAGSDDRRVRVSSLTHTGESILRQTPGSSALGGTVMMQGLSHDERNQLVELLKRCTRNLNPLDEQTWDSGSIERKENNEHAS
ncbi:MAG: hypothetical protein NVS2B16_13760 [Chloroflexota bacterium]